MMTVYQDLDQQFIHGQWQHGTSTKIIKNINPFTQTEIMSLAAASSVDVDSAYTAAEQAFQQGVLNSIEVRKTVLQNLINK